MFVCYIYRFEQILKSMVVMADIVCPVVRADVTCYWKDMWRRLDAMRRLWQLCDVRLKTDDGSSFMAHSPVLAASSDVLHHMLVATQHETFVDGPGIVPVRNVTPDVLRITLDFIYGVTPTSRADFERLRVGAARLGIEGAYEYCCRRLGEKGSGFQHMTDVTVLPSGPAAITAVVEPSGSTVSEDLASRAEEVSTGDQNSANENTNLEAVIPTSEVPELVDTVVPSNDVHHAATMAHMSLADLARSDECPHLRQLASELLPVPILESECLVDESSGSLEDGSGFLDSVPLKKRTRSNNLSDSQGSGVQEEVNGLYTPETVSSENAVRTDAAGNHTTQQSACGLSAVSLNVETPNQYPQTILTDNISIGSQCGSVNQTATTSVNIARSLDFNNALYETSDFPALSMLKTDLMTHPVPDACMSYANDGYPMTGLSSNSSWSADRHLGMAVTTSNSPSLITHVPLFGGSSFESILSTADVTRMVDSTSSCVHYSTADVSGSTDILNGCPQDMNFPEFCISSNHWPHGVPVSLPQASSNGISQVASVPADTGIMYFGQSSVTSTASQYVPPAFTMNPLSSSSAVAVASVADAGAVAADLSYISLDDVSAVLKANGFSDKTSSPSTSEVSPENHTTKSCKTENHLGENHASDVNKAGTQTTVNGTPSAVTRVCLFCEKPCKSER